MSSARHTVTRVDILRGRGNFPHLTPARKPDRLIGSGPSGASICFTRTYPVAGKSGGLEWPECTPLSFGITFVIAFSVVGVEHPTKMSGI